MVIGFKRGLAMEKIKSVYIEGVEDGTWGYWYENGQVAWGNSYDMGLKTGEWLYFQEDGKPSKTLNYKDDVFDGDQIKGKAFHLQNLIYI